MDFKEFESTSIQEVKMARNSTEPPEADKQNGLTEKKTSLTEARTDLTHKVKSTSHDQRNVLSTDLGEYYTGRMQETMEEWYSKPRDGQDVTDVVMCPRQKVYREIDRIPIDAKAVSIYSAGKAIHEAIQRLFLSDKRTFEREKYIEYEDIQGSPLEVPKHNIARLLTIMSFKHCASRFYS